MNLEDLAFRRPGEKTRIECHRFSHRGAHIAELRQRIDHLRLWHGLAAAAWTDASLTRTVSTVKAVHLLEWRSALGEVYVAAGRTAPTYTRTTLTAGTTIITAVDVSDLRAAVVAIW